MTFCRPTVAYWEARRSADSMTRNNAPLTLDRLPSLVLSQGVVRGVIRRVGGFSTPWYSTFTGPLIF